MYCYSYSALLQSKKWLSQGNGKSFFSKCHSAQRPIEGGFFDLFGNGMQIRCSPQFRAPLADFGGKVTHTRFLNRRNSDRGNIVSGNSILQHEVFRIKLVQVQFCAFQLLKPAIFDDYDMSAGAADILFHIFCSGTIVRPEAHSGTISGCQEIRQVIFVDCPYIFRGRIKIPPCDRPWNKNGNIRFFRNME